MDTLQLYLDRIAQTHRVLDTRGMLQVPELSQVELEDVYVPPTLCLHDDMYAWRDIGHDGDHRRSLSEFPAEQDPAAEFLWRDPYALGEESGLDLDSLWERHEHWIVLGNPGAGKTTLLKYLALRQARNLAASQGAAQLPVWIDLERFALAWEQNPAWDPAEALLNYLGGAGLEALGFNPEQRQVLLGSIKLTLNGHNGLLLLDGLDMVNGGDARQRCSEAVELLLHHYPGNRCLLTLHHGAYQKELFQRSFQRACLEPFNPKQVQRFFHNWMFALEKLEDLVVDEDTRLRAGRKAADMLAGITRKSAVCNEFASPLLCTLVAVVYRQVGSLPEQRIELYKLCVDTLILNWEVYKRRLGVGGQGLSRDEIQQVLETLALHMQENGRHQLSQGEIFEIVKSFLAGPGATEEQIQHKAEQFSDLLELEAGLLTHVSSEQFGFFHLVFQDYLAARAMTRRLDTLEDYLRRYLFNPKWRGVIQLAAAHQGMKDEAAGSAFIKAMQGHPHPREAQMHYAFRLAFQSLRETRVSFQTADHMFHEWIRLYTDQPELQPALNRLLRDAGDLRYKPRAITPLLDAARQHDPVVRCKAIEALGGLRDPNGLPMLLDLLKEDPQPGVRAKAAEVLGEFQEPQSVPALLASLKHDNAFPVRRRAAQTLSRFRHPTVLPALLQSLQDRDATTRWRAAESLGQLKDPRAVQPLMTVLREDAVPGVRWRAAEALGQLKDPQALPVLLDVFSSDSDVNVRSRATEALGYYPSAEVLPALLKALKDDRFPAVRWRAAEALGRVKDPQVVPPLLEALKHDVDNAVRWSAAEALGQLGDRHAVPELLATLRGDIDPSVRWSAAEALGLLHDPAAVSVLLETLRQDKFASVRGKTCQALGHLRDCSATPTLLKTLKDDPDPGVRRLAAEALGYLQDPIALPSLLNALKQDEDANVRWSAAEALGCLKDPAAVASLLHAIGHDPELGVRWRAAYSLELIDLGCPI